MAELNDIIKANRSLLDDIEPMQGHFNRFRKKVERPDSFRSILAPVVAAASIAIVVTLFLFSVKMNYENRISFSDISVEYEEAEAYYQNAFLDEHDKFLKNSLDDSSIKEYVEKELVLMAESYEQLVNDFRTNPYDTRMISAIIMHYQTKVDFLKDINSRLENNNVKTVKDFSYEGDRI